MADKPVRAFGSNLVQIIGAVIVVFGLLALPGPGAWTAIILGGILVVAATSRYMRYSQGG